VNPLSSQSNPPAITQLAWLLHSILSQDPAGNHFIGLEHGITGLARPVAFEF